MRHVHKKISNVARRAAERRIARTHHADSFEPTHAAIHFEAKIGDVVGGDLLENVNQRMPDVIGQLQNGLFLPAGGDLFEVQRRKFALDFIFEGEVKIRPARWFCDGAEWFWFRADRGRYRERKKRFRPRFAVAAAARSKFWQPETASGKIRRAAGRNK